MMTIAELNALCPGTLMGHLGIEYTEIGEDYLCARMPVNHTTWQPMQILHGGATMALVESVGSGLSLALLNGTDFIAKGMEINANHIRSAKSGWVYARAQILHRGQQTHIVEVKVTDELNKLISICRITNIIIPQR